MVKVLQFCIVEWEWHVHHERGGADASEGNAEREPELWVVGGEEELEQVHVEEGEEEAHLHGGAASHAGNVRLGKKGRHEHWKEFYWGVLHVGAITALQRNFSIVVGAVNGVGERHAMPYAGCGALFFEAPRAPNNKNKSIEIPKLGKVEGDLCCNF
jgi:hypothetical protein